MNLYQCQNKAKDEGFDTATFDAHFPAGIFKCTWTDAYFGLFTVDHPTLKGILFVDQIDGIFPDLACENFNSAGGE